MLDAAHLYDRPGNPYLGPDGKDWPDNARRYAALSMVAAEIGRGLIPGYEPGVVHCHDWQAGLAAAYLFYGGGPKCVITVHNLAFQGHFPASVFGVLGLPPRAFAIDGVEYFGGVGFLKAGIRLADAITTVSPTYAREILTPEDGMGLDGLLRTRSDALCGIVNGIDTDVWNPAADTFIAEGFSAKALAKRAQNKRAVEARFGLEPGDGILYCIVSRLTLQKGMDLVAAAVPKLVEEGARLAVLGSGDAGLEGVLKGAAARHAGRIGIATTYDEPLSHLLQARLRRDPHPVALRALRPDPALRPPLWLRAGRRPRRRPRRHHRRRQRRGGGGGRGLRHPIRAGDPRRARTRAWPNLCPLCGQGGVGGDAARRNEGRCIVGPQRPALRPTLPLAHAAGVTKRAGPLISRVQAHTASSGI